MADRTIGGRRTRRGFTLLELTVSVVVVVIGSVFLLNVVRNAQRAAGDVACQSNLAQIGDAVLAYCVDNNGSYPYGYYYDPRDPVSWQPMGGKSRQITWVEVINPYLATGGRGKLSERFRCPDAQAQAGSHPLSYVMNMVVGVTPSAELVIGMPPRAQLKPSRISLVLREGTALLWDTAVSTEWDENELGYLVGADIDNQRFWRGAATPQWRYFNPDDVYGRIPPGVFGQNAPVGMGTNWKNVDATVPFAGYPYQGNLRYRHVDQTKCNVAFSDGSVRQFTAVIRPDLSLQSHDALRRYFMTEWPPNTPRDPSVP